VIVGAVWSGVLQFVKGKRVASIAAEHANQMRRDLITIGPAEPL
jgi:hypothetical protein